jgi:hypothetical protein
MEFFASLGTTGAMIAFGFLGLLVGSFLNVVPLPKFEIFQHKLFGNVMAGVFIMLVIVDAFYEDRPAVYHQLLVFYLYGAT